jgi:hypothetical protein
MFKPAVYLISLILFIFATQTQAQAENNAIDINKPGGFEASLSHDKLTRYFRVYRAGGT